MRLLLCFLGLLCCVNGFSQSQWYPYTEKGKTVWVSANQQSKIPASSIVENNGWLVSTMSGKKGIIDSQGKLILDTVYSTLIKVGETKDSLFGFTLFSQRNKAQLGLINLKGKVLLSPGYSAFQKIGKSRISYSFLAGGKKKCGLIDLNGKKITNANYNSLESISDSLISYSITPEGENRFGLLDLNGKIILQPQHANFKVISHKENENYFILYNKVFSASRQDSLRRFGEYEPFATGVISSSGKILTPPIFRDFQVYNPYLLAGVLLLGKESKYKMIFYDFNMKKVKQVNGYNAFSNTFFNPGYQLSFQIIHSDKYHYYFHKDKIIDSFEVAWKFDKMNYHNTVYRKNDPCGYEAQEFFISSIGRGSIYRISNDFSPLHSVFTERGHTLLNDNQDTIFHSTTNHFFKSRYSSDIHIRTCEGKWGLFDESGKELVLPIYDSMIKIIGFFYETYSEGKPVWLNRHYKKLETGEYEVVQNPAFLHSPKRPYNEYSYGYSPFLFVHQLDTEKFGVIDTAGNIIVSVDYDGIYPIKAGFIVEKKSKRMGYLIPKRTKTGFIAFDGDKLEKVSFRKQVVTYRTEFDRVKSLGKKFIPYGKNKYVIITKNKYSGLITVKKKVLLKPKYTSIRRLDGSSIYMVRKDSICWFYNADLKKFITGPLSSETTDNESVDFDYDNNDTITPIIFYTDNYISKRMQLYGTPIEKWNLRVLNSEFGTYKIMQSSAGKIFTDENDSILLQDGYQWIVPYGNRVLFLVKGSENFFYDVPNRKLYPTDCNEMSDDFYPLLEDRKIVVGETAFGTCLYDSNFRKLLPEDASISDWRLYNHGKLIFTTQGSLNIYNFYDNSFSKPYNNITGQLCRYGNLYDFLSAEGEMQIEGAEMILGTNYYCLKKGETIYWVTKQDQIYHVSESD